MKIKYDQEKSMKTFFLFVLIFVIGCGPDFSRPVWSVKLQGRAYADVLVDGEICYVFSQAGEALALQIATGKELWKQRMAGPLLATPVVSRESIFVVTQDGTVFRLRKGDGSIEWQKDLDAPVIAPLALFKRTLLVPSETGTLHALDADNGSDLWKLFGQKKFNAAPVYARNRIFLGGWEKEFFCLKEDGTVDWRFRSAEIITDHAVVFKGHVFFPSYDQFVYGLDAQTGKLSWRYPAHRPSNLVLVNEQETGPSQAIVFASGTDLVYLSPSTGTLLRRLKFGKIINRLYAHGSDLYVVANELHRINSSKPTTSVAIDAPNPIFKLTFTTGMTLVLDELYSIYGYAPIQN